MLKQYTVLTVSFAAFTAMGTAFAQPAETAQRTGDDAQYIEIQRARTDMENARRQLEEAARTIVRRAPGVSDFEPLIINATNYANFGLQSQIGATIVDADDGALVTSVASGGGAEAAGLKVGDVIQSIDEIDLTEADEGAAAQLRERLREVETGDHVNIVAERAGNRVELDIETRAGPAWVKSLARNINDVQVFSRDDRNGDGLYSINVAPWGDGPDLNIFRTLGFASSPWGDMELVTVTENLGRYFDTTEGLLVVSAPGDETMDIDIQEGDVILSISGRKPNSPEHAIRILSSFESGETVELSIMRDRRKRTIEYAIPASRNASALVLPSVE